MVKMVVFTVALTTHTGVTSCDSIALAILAASLRSFLDERSAADLGTLERAATTQSTPRADSSLCGAKPR